MIDQYGLNGPVGTPDNFVWNDVFGGGPKGNVARTYFLDLPEIRRFRTDALFRLIFDGESLTLAGQALGLVLRALSALSFGRFSLFHLRDDKIEFPESVVSAKRFAAQILKRLRGAPGYFSGGLILNLAGYQVTRTLYYHLRYSLRRRALAAGAPASEIEKAVCAHGYTVVEDMLRPETLAGLNRVLDDPVRLMQYKRDDHTCGWTKCVLHAGGESFAAANAEDFDPHAREVLADRRIFDLVERLAGRKIDVTPEVAVFEWKVPADKAAVDHQFDFEDMLHADISYPSYKIFLYLNDVTVANGPFVYCPDTHKLTFKRLLMEYVFSIAFYLTDKPPPNVPQPHRLTNWLIHKLGIRVVPVTGRANSMVLANVMGFHGRHRFDSTEPRRALFLNFRYLDAKLIY